VPRAAASAAWRPGAGLLPEGWVDGDGMAASREYCRKQTLRTPQKDDLNRMEETYGFNGRSS